MTFALGLDVIEARRSTRPAAAYAGSSSAAVLADLAACGFNGSDGNRWLVAVDAPLTCAAEPAQRLSGNVYLVGQAVLQGAAGRRPVTDDCGRQRNDATLAWWGGLGRAVAQLQGLSTAVLAGGSVANDGLLQNSYASYPQAVLQAGEAAQLKAHPAIGGVAAAAPSDGWWWNSAESGRGFLLEQQRGKTFLGGFIYDTAGRPTWFVSRGQPVGGTPSATIERYCGGQTLTGAYRPAAAIAASDAMQVSFSRSDRGTLTWPTGNTVLQRFEMFPQARASANADLAPQRGWWWSPEEPGRGFGLEIQGNDAFLAGFMYQADGAPAWYVSQGPLGVVNGRPVLSGAWQQFAGGQALGARHTSPRADGSPGSLHLRFLSTDQAELVLPNGRVLHCGGSRSERV